MSSQIGTKYSLHLSTDWCFYHWANTCIYWTCQHVEVIFFFALHLRVYFRLRSLSLRCSTFIPPQSTRDNAQKWHKDGFQIVDTIVKSRNELVQNIKAIVKNETELLKKESDLIRVGRGRECETIAHRRSRWIGKSATDGSLRRWTDSPGSRAWHRTVARRTPALSPRIHPGSHSSTRSSSNWLTTIQSIRCLRHPGILWTVKKLSKSSMSISTPLESTLCCRSLVSNCSPVLM